jgi:hypothetical protein
MEEAVLVELTSSFDKVRSLVKPRTVLDFIINTE